MERRSTNDPTFLQTVADWLAADGECFAVIRHPNAGGTKSYEHFVTVEDLVGRMSRLAPATSVVVCKGRHLPLRGHVDDTLIANALANIPDGQEWLIIGQLPVNYGLAWWFPDANGDSHEELLAELRGDTYFGQSVFVGIVPPWWEGDSDVITSAYVPNPDGSITPAAY